MLNTFSCAFWPSVCLLWRNVYLGLLSIFWLGCFLLLCCLYTSYLYILEIKPLSVASFATLFSPSIGCLLRVFFFYDFLCCEKACKLISSHLFIFVFILVALWDWPKKTYVQFMSEDVLPIFSSKRFMVSCLMLRSKPFWVYFCPRCESVF